MPHAVQSLDLNVTFIPLINRTNWAITCVEKFPPGSYFFEVKGCNRITNNSFTAGALENQGGELNSSSIIIQVFY